MSDDAKIVWALLVVLVACLAGLVRIWRAIERAIAKEMDEEWNPY